MSDVHDSRTTNTHSSKILWSLWALAVTACSTPTEPTVFEVNTRYYKNGTVGNEITPYLSQWSCKPMDEHWDGIAWNVTYVCGNR